MTCSTFDPDEESGDVDPGRPHCYHRPQLRQSRQCAVCGQRETAAIHAITAITATARPPALCPECGAALEFGTDLCPAGHLDTRDLDHRPRVTSRDRFGNRNR